MSVVPRVRQKEAFRGPVASASSDIVPASPGGYMRGERSDVFRGWYPGMRDAHEAVSAAYSRAAGRANDVIQNSGWITGAIDQAVANTVGDGLRLSSLPDAELLGWSEEEATAFGDMIEKRHALWADNPMECDIEGRRTFGQMQSASFRAWFGVGEMLSEAAWKRRPGYVYGTKVRLIPAHRLSQRTAAPRLVQGVQMDADWMPVSYWFRRMSMNSEQEIEVPARERDGRPRIVHVFEGIPGQYRGISPLVSVLETARRFDQLSGATLTSNLIRAVFAATIKSDEPTEEVMAGLMTEQELAKMQGAGLTPFECWASMNEGWYKNAQIDLGQNGRFAHLFPGQELEFHSAADSASDYKEMSMLLLRELLRCLGLTFESGTGDYTGATYSSVRMAVNEIYQITLQRRKNIVTPFCQAHYVCWLEEEIASGRLPLKGGLAFFYANKAALTRTMWTGSPMPQADVLKTAKGHREYRDMGVISDEEICSERGVDVRDVYRKRAREKKMREDLGLPENGPARTDVVADALVTEKEE